MTDAATTPMTFETAPKLMGSGKNLDYVMIALRNGIALGFKWYGAHPVNLPDDGAAVRLHLHVRSCRPTAHEIEAVNVGNVTAFGSFDRLSEYWPDFKFDNDGHASENYGPQNQRASGELLYFAKGVVAYDAETQEVTVPEDLTNGKAVETLTATLIEVADPGTAVLTAEQISEVLRDIIGRLVEAMITSTKSELGLAGSVGGGMTKKLLNELGVGDHAAKAAVEGEDDDEEGDDEGDDDTEELDVEEDGDFEGDEASDLVEPEETANDDPADDHIPYGEGAPFVPASGIDLDVAPVKKDGTSEFTETPKDDDKSNG